VVVTGGLLSDAQLKSVICAGEAHAGYLAGAWTVDETFDAVSAASDDANNAIRFRRGWFLGDGTGAGKGRQVAGILLYNWLKGRRRAVWISKSDKLIDDAQRDWSALCQERLLITPLSRFRPASPIRLEQGILFTTYATLRSDGREEKLSRVQQIVDWLGRDFDGVIVFDESHAMQNAAGEKSERGERAPSLQGRAGLRLQHALPNARVVYVSATGATTVHNLAYAQRLGLGGGADFATRAEFVEAIEAGGVAAMEVLARDLKALGLYAARSLSFAGIEYELLEHQLTDEQVRIYDAYAAAFQVIHNNLNAALQAANVTGETGTLNRQAKSAARSAFESANATGLRLTDNDGSLREDLPPITTFLNRLLALTIDLQNTLFSVFDDLLRAKVEGAIASGTYDIGVETIIAESLIVTDRRTLYTHPQGGAETSVFTITRRDRNRPFTLGEALERAKDRHAKLLINDQSKRAAVQVPAPSLMRDDGTVERRVRLLRPMERPAIPFDDLTHSHWREVDRAEFIQAWDAEIAGVPEFTDSNLHIVTGLLLPIWKRLPNDSMRVYRLQADDCERIIGRLVSPAWVAEAVETDAPTLAPADAFAAVLDGRTVLQLQDGLELRRVKIMSEFRIELSAFSDGMLERLKAIGLISEIISWKLRLFVPTGTAGPAILAKLMERHPLVRLADKTAA
jgi:P-loop containing NTP hydrolase pore-1